MRDCFGISFLACSICVDNAQLRSWLVVVLLESLLLLLLVLLLLLLLLIGVKGLQLEENVE